MLLLPTTGVARSVKVQNVKLEAICDWIEGCLLFDDDVEELSGSDIVDVLLDDNIYDNQDFAWEIVNDAFAAMRRRQKYMRGDASFSAKRQSIRCIKTWKENPAHGFCLALSYAEWYPSWASSFGRDYTKQGTLFEKFVEESFKCLFPRWEVVRTGWSPSNPDKIKKVINLIATHLEGVAGNIEQYVTGRENELGLDLLCYRPFENNLASILICFMQCASGKEWKNKLHTPVLETWGKLVDSPSYPRKAFAIPFALPEDEMSRIAPQVKGLLLDRYRLLSSSQYKKEWLSEDLKAELIKWLIPRVEALPRDYI